MRQCSGGGNNLEQFAGDCSGWMAHVPEDPVDLRWRGTRQRLVSFDRAESWISDVLARLLLRDPPG